MVTRNEDCNRMEHQDTQTWFGSHCEDCGSLTIFADDVQYLTNSNDRWNNQDNIENTFDRVVNYLNSCRLEVNQ